MAVLLSEIVSVEIWDPFADGSHTDMPIYDGPADQAGRYLIPGDYPATGWTEDGRSAHVTVTLHHDDLGRVTSVEVT